MTKEQKIDDRENSNVRWACTEIINAASKGFYGAIVVQMQHGKVVSLRKDESIKPPTQ